MAREWILNIANSRWGLTKKNRVGPVAQWIRECAPKEISEWEKYYFKKLEEFLVEKKINLKPEEYLEELGRKLYVKVSEVLKSEIDQVTEKDCIEYIKELVIKRTFEGYLTEKETVHGQLELLLGFKIEPAPDEWDRVYNVDYFIKVGDKFIGIQIKPSTFEHAPEFATKWKDVYRNSHEKFSKRFGGKVFIVISTTRDRKKTIFNIEVIDEIKKEIERLKAESDSS